MTKINPAGSGLVYSTQLGGGGADTGFGIAVDSEGSAYITGSTFSSNFPTVNPIFPRSGSVEAFVAKLNPAGSALVYSSYLGGSFAEYGVAIAVDAQGNAYVTGTTASNNFPTANPIQPFTAGGNGGDVFVTKVNAAGSALVYSTYLGGSGSETIGGIAIGGIAVDSAGNAYVTGSTDSTNFPTANAIQPTFGGGTRDGFVTKINAAGSALSYSTYLGGSGADSGVDLALDSAGNAYITGSTDSANFPTVAGSFDTTVSGQDAFIAKISAGPPEPPAARLGNISTRLRVETGDNALIGGFIVTGTQPKKVIVRAIGPSLPVTGKLANPTLELFGPAGLITSNDNWQESPNKQAIIDSTVPPSHPLESAIVATLPANATEYTAVVRGAGGATGIGLVEVFDLDRAVDSELANISSRGFVQTGDNAMIGGFIITGTTSRKVIVRAIGPSLPVAGKLADPTLELFNANGQRIALNNNWRDTQQAEIIASMVPPTNDLESAIVSTLPPGNTTAVVRGNGGTTGVALVEVYALQ